MKSNLINQKNSDNHLESINPNSNNFDFQSWAIAVRRQMLTVLESNWEKETKIDEEE